VQRESQTLDDLEQIRVLAHPLRIRILEAFGEERTTKQVAGILGEKPTRLYHHVDLLERVGLIAPTRTRPNRGTVEKYYLAVARTFQADSRVFLPGRKGETKKSAAIRKMITTIFDTTSAELAALACREGSDARETIAEEAFVSFLEIRASPEKLNDVRRQLNELVRSLEAEGSATSSAAPESSPPHRLTLAYYPLLEGARPAPRSRGPKKRR
jgi:hypothetical protein